MDSKEFRKYAVGHLGLSGNTLDNYSAKVDIPMPTNLTPYIIEERPMNVAQMDVFSRLMMDRIIFLGTGIDDQVANIVTAQLLFLESVDRARDVQMYLNSPGGSVYAGLGIYDTMQVINPDVSTICTGIAASMGAVLMCAGAEGKRTALRHSRIMLHQPSSAIGGQATDIEITVKEIQRVKKNLYTVISDHTGQPYEKVAIDCDRDYWMIAEEAKAYGLVDEVLGVNPKKVKGKKDA
ncbi:MAG: ATP-dependent Clp protease proteolytic subunit [Sphingobacteriales bacterium]|nr:MAG: ATP-dependent Clp protease proteolytic subunit [Sphingobacteriales bacterium]